MSEKKTCRSTLTRKYYSCSIKKNVPFDSVLLLLFFLFSYGMPGMLCLYSALQSDETDEMNFDQLVKRDSYT
jgi:hypothetical protein